MLPASNACVLCLFSSCWMSELLVAHAMSEIAGFDCILVHLFVLMF